MDGSGTQLLPRTRRSKFVAGVTVALVAVIAVAAVWATRGGREEPGLREFAEAPPAGDGARDTPTIHPVRINRPEGPPTIEVAGVGMFGEGASIACSTCHSVREPNPTNRTPADLDEFHQGMAYAHGDLACFACHNPDDYDALRLADGSTVPYREVMTLCAQCHGPQARDYQHGAHGGMSGYWDLSRGPRVRNNCVDCHDPHVPAFPSMVPTFKPIDRFLTSEGSKVEEIHE